MTRETLSRLGPEILFAGVAAIVGYAADTALLNFLPSISHLWRDMIAVTIGFLVAFSIIRRRRV